MSLGGGSKKEIMVKAVQNAINNGEDYASRISTQTLTRLGVPIVVSAGNGEPWHLESWEPVLT
jgi:hypothetical protein